MGVTVVSCLLLIISPMPWWTVLILSWVMCPILLVAQKPLVRGLGRAFTRHRAEVQMAVSAGLVNATLATGLLAGTWLPALVTGLLGVLTWMATSAALALLLPVHTSIGSPAPSVRAERAGTADGRPVLVQRAAI
ncbi:hypothetical protein GCM10020229_00040 [Kitasatospora albolonga]|uniref:hypothetical protein n=1 Tax=Kitasatospora albolonga TaxID=68173 RepID=UPI0031EFBF6A